MKKKKMIGIIEHNWKDAQINYELTDLKEKIKDCKKQVEKYMNKDNYLVLCISKKGDEMQSWGSIKDIKPEYLKLFFEGYVNSLEVKDE